MKIGIITLPLHTNYGGILQAYALQTVLERMGHVVEVIDKQRKPLTTISLSVRIKRAIKKYILRQSVPPVGEFEYYKRRAKENKYSWRFADKYIHRREIIRFTDIKESDYDCIVVGSDQVWRPRYFTTNYNTTMAAAFLEFAQTWDIKRISYAASLGADQWEYTQGETEACRELIKLFDAVSVREPSGATQINKYLHHKEVYIVPDPTLLLNKNDYFPLYKNESTSKGNLLVYLINETEDKKKLVCKISQAKHLIPLIVNTQVENNSITSKGIQVQPPVEKWLKGFEDAEFIITDSFHACVFSILFQKPFIVYGNTERGLSRIKFLLQTFGLIDRLVFDSDVDINKIKSPLPEEYKINTIRQIGYDFLLCNIN